MAKSVLISKIRTEIRRRNLSYQTEQTYIGWITRFIYYHDLEHPKNMGEQEVVSFLNHLVINRQVSNSIQSEARSALHFLYRYVIQQPLQKLSGVKKGKIFYRSRWPDKQQRITAS